MPNKLTGLGLICVMLAVVAVFEITSKGGQGVSGLQEINKPETLRELAEAAKTNGEHQVTIQTPNIEYGVAESFNKALSHNSVVIAKPVEKKSYATESEDIITWYRFKVIETLFQNNNSNCKSCPPAPVPPGDLLPIAQDEIIIPKYGGTLTIDGVTINSVDPKFPDFVMNHDYLLFISVLQDSNSRVGALRMGPFGTYAINTDGRIEAVGISRRIDHFLKHDIETTFGNSLDRVRRGLKSRVDPQ
jgi:hypothetical protein